MGYGFIPFLYLPAVSLGINAMMFGGFASYYVQDVYKRQGLWLAVTLMPA